MKKYSDENNENLLFNTEIKEKLLKTIKPTDNFASLNNQLPRAKY
jgi:hypothetical protein